MNGRISSFKDGMPGIRRVNEARWLTWHPTPAAGQHQPQCLHTQDDIRQPYPRQPQWLHEHRTAVVTLTAMPTHTQDDIRHPRPRRRGAGKRAHTRPSLYTCMLHVRGTRLVQRMLRTSETHHRLGSTGRQRGRERERERERERNRRRAGMEERENMEGGTD